MPDFNVDSPPLGQQQEWMRSRTPSSPPPWVAEGVAPVGSEPPPWVTKPWRPSAEPEPEPEPQASPGGDAGSASDAPRRERYVRTEDIERAVKGRGADILRALGV